MSLCRGDGLGVDEVVVAFARLRLYRIRQSHVLVLYK